jgi:hypothetical protein
MTREWAKSPTNELLMPITPPALPKFANRHALEILWQIWEHLRSYKAARVHLVLKEYLRLTPRNGHYTPGQLQERELFF